MKDYKSQLDNFKLFWDSQTPRIGDPESHGWFVWFQSTQIREIFSKPQPNFTPKKTASQSKPNQQIEDESQDEIQTWFQNEKQKEQFIYPFRPKFADKSDCDIHLQDPDRVVLYEDLENCLFHLNSDDLKMELVFRFLEFLGLYLPIRSSTNSLYYANRFYFLDSIPQIKEIFCSQDLAFEHTSKIEDPERVAFLR